MKWTMSIAVLAVCCAAIGMDLSQGRAGEAPPPLAAHPARKAPEALTAPLHALACAGTRQVAVGDHGVVLLSDDGGAQWRQARQVPVDSVLTAVTFVSERAGWAVGHAGVVLHTDDGGEHWQLQRRDLHEDRPLFGVHFFDDRQGVAVGLWSKVLRTADGGQTWQAQGTGLPKAAGLADLNLYALFTDAAGRVYAPAERGMVLRSADRGETWAALPTGHKGSFWSGTALPAAGGLVVVGLRGAIWRSDDDGATWRAVARAANDSLSGVAAGPDGRVDAVGADGQWLVSTDGGRSFASRRREDRLPLNGLGRCGAATGPTLLSVRGPLLAGTANR